MPNRDGTGPEGKGSKTGRQRGNCEVQEDKFVRGQGLGVGKMSKGLGRMQDRD